MKKLDAIMFSILLLATTAIGAVTMTTTAPSVVKTETIVSVNGATQSDSIVTITVAAPATGPTPPVIPPVIPPTTLPVPPIASTQPYPGMPGEVYNSDTWLKSFPEDADGYTIFPTAKPVMIAPSNGVTQAGDCADENTAFAKAAAQGTLCVEFYRVTTTGQTAIYTASQINAGVPSGNSPAAPFVICATPDVKNPRPIIQGSIGNGSKNPTQFLVIADLDFEDASGKVNSSSIEAGIRIVDSVPGGQYLWIEGNNCRFMQSFLEIQETLPSGATTGTPYHTAIVRRNTFSQTGGPNNGQRFGCYYNFVRDLCVAENACDLIGWDGVTPSQKNIFTHAYYSQEFGRGEGAIPANPADADPQNRFCFNFVSRPSAYAIEQRPGGEQYGNLILGAPGGAFVAEYASRLESSVADGGGFDLTMGTGNTRGYGFSSVICPTVTLANDLCIDKADQVNCGWAFQVQTNSTGSAPSVATVATMQNLIANGWDVWLNSGNFVNGPTYQTSDTISNGPPPVYLPPILSFLICDLPGYIAPGVIPTQKYLDATRCVNSYGNLIGANGQLGFIAGALANRRGAYSAAYTTAAANAWIQAGFIAVAN